MEKIYRGGGETGFSTRECCSQENTLEKKHFSGKKNREVIFLETQNRGNLFFSFSVCFFAS